MPTTSDQRTTADPVPDPGAGSSRARGRVRRYAVLVTLSLLLALLVRGLLVEAVHVPDISMTPALQPGDRLLMSRVTDPTRGDVIMVDTAPSWGSQRTTYVDDGLIGSVLSTVSDAVGIDLDEQGMVLRVVAVAGDRVSIREDGAVAVAGRTVRAATPGPAEGAREPVELTVPDGRVWVLADSPGRVADSMTHLDAAHRGSVPTSDVLGTVVLRYWPLGSLGGVDGAPS